MKFKEFLEKNNFKIEEDVQPFKFSYSLAGTKFSEDNILAHVTVSDMQRIMVMSLYLSEEKKVTEPAFLKMIIGLSEYEKIVADYPPKNNVVEDLRERGALTFATLLNYKRTSKENFDKVLAGRN